jgi:hypothetical protein
MAIVGKGQFRPTNGGTRIAIGLFVGRFHVILH